MADVLQDAVNFYHQSLYGNGYAMTYLAQRKIKNHSIEYFDLGSTAPKDLFVTHMLDILKYDPEVVEAAGLMYNIDGTYKETFVNAIIIPFKDTEGRVINITGRSLNPQYAKYRNLAHVPIIDFFGTNTIKDRYKYNKINNLEDYVFICEGQIDTITLQQEGMFSLGILGVNNIRKKMFDHMEWFENVVLVFDNDKPGIDGANSLAGMIKYVYPYIKFWSINFENPGEDVNSYFAKYGKKKFIKLIKPLEVEAKPFAKEKSKHIVNKEVDFRLDAVKSIRMLDFLKSISNYPLTKTHKTHKTKCPFTDHKDTVGSFTIYNDNNTFYCFGCSRGGDVIQLCREFFGVPFKEAIEILLKWKRKR